MLSTITVEFFEQTACKAYHLELMSIEGKQISKHTFLATTDHFFFLVTYSNPPSSLTVYKRKFSSTLKQTINYSV